LLEELAKLEKPLTPRIEEITTDIKQTFRDLDKDTLAIEVVIKLQSFIS
jgi:hypothetical protein